MSVHKFQIHDETKDLPNDIFEQIFDTFSKKGTWIMASTPRFNIWKQDAKRKLSQTGN